MPVTVIKNGLAYNIVNGQTPVGEPDYSQGTGHTGAGAGSASTIINTDSNVPQKIATPTSVKWMNECEFIENGYSQFANWVKGGDLESDGKTLKRYGPENKLWYQNYWAPEKIHEFYDKNPGTAIGGRGAFIGIQIELTPNTIAEVGDVENGVLKIAKWNGQAPIWEHLNNIDDSDYFTITVVYDGDPGKGVMLPVNGDSKESLINNMTNQPVGTLTPEMMYDATELRMDVVTGYDDKDTPNTENRVIGYTHRFSYRKTAAMKCTGGYCDYMVLWLNSLPSDVKVTGMYISYESHDSQPTGNSQNKIL